MSLPDADMVEMWLHQLGDSDHAYANACAIHTAAKEGLKICKAAQMPATGTVAEKERQALLSPEYAAALDKLTAAEYEKTVLNLKREQWIMGIDVWRSINANQRRS
jgi:hypothetical protein|tara:strand:- start:1179 stop:1496 length:318 start_codon:yes stop_codon:yes gene_type:complete